MAARWVQRRRAPGWPPGLDSPRASHGPPRSGWCMRFTFSARRSSSDARWRHGLDRSDDGLEGVHPSNDQGRNSYTSRVKSGRVSQSVVVLRSVRRVAVTSVCGCDAWAACESPNSSSEAPSCMGRRGPHAVRRHELRVSSRESQSNIRPLSHSSASFSVGDPTDHSVDEPVMWLDDLKSLKT